ncbi:NADH-quinone oxidoreductase subunit J [Pedobacter sp. HMF7647]|uniref:NADH-quinone oxidoreductase subunit J n=1 Tax=Hufsiella arboris TaxID=2695275 RepID=A0A7K1YBD6_9SPHI|nr:NADH-quinone oxidoreductase subunit J [Hufsiella arboris]MXV51409.1 NADH-quinone oxidoreductase subunit J [Hufsiella arboris]
MTPEQIIFYVFAALVIISALLAVVVKSLVRSIFLFFVTLFAVAGLFVLSLGDFVAVTQIIVYVGGVLVLMLFAFMLSSKELLNTLELVKTRYSAVQNIPAIVLSLALFFILVFALVKSNVNQLDWINGGNHLSVSDNTVQIIGINLMTNYLFPFEVASVFLMMALIGAAHLARKDKAE